MSSLRRSKRLEACAFGLFHFLDFSGKPITLLMQQKLIWIQRSIFVTNLWDMNLSLMVAITQISRHARFRYDRFEGGCSPCPNPIQKTASPSQRPQSPMRPGREPARRPIARGQRGSVRGAGSQPRSALLSVARRIVRSEEDARDCVQETFLSAYRKIGDFEERSRLRTWLHRIVTNAALMKLRARKPVSEAPLDRGTPSYDVDGFRDGPRRANSYSPEELLMRADTRKQVHFAIDRLPESYRTVLLLRDIEGYNTQEVAVSLATTEGNVKVRLHRARTALKELLTPLFEEDASDA